MNILITICARGGSKGIPGKNVKLLAGKPLIAYTIELATELKSLWHVKVALSTDSDEIKAIAGDYGLETSYLRPESLSLDSTGKIDTIRDLLIFEESMVDFKYDFVLDLDITSPLRTLEDVRSALEKIKNTPDAKTLFSVNRAARNPYFNMVEQDSTGFFALVKKNTDGTIKSRQLAPKVYELNASFYWYRRTFFDSQDQQSVITDKSIIYEMNHVCFDLDESLDFLFMEYLINSNMLDFKL